MGKTKGGSTPPARPEAQQAAQLYAQGRHQAALQVASGALLQHPDDALLWNLAAAAAHALGLLDDAEQFWRTAVAKRPRYAEAHYNLGCLLLQRQRDDEAETVFRRVLAIEPAHAMALNNLAAILGGSQRAAEGLPLVQRSLALAPDNVSAYNNLGLILQSIGRGDEAQAAFDRAIALQPLFAEAWCSRGLLQMERGRIADAERDLTESLRLQPDYVKAFFNLLLLRNLRADEPLMAQLTELYGRRAALPVDRIIPLDFSMGRALEGVGRYDEAFAAYAEGNRLHYQHHPYDEAADQANLDALVARYTPELFARCAEAARALPPLDDPRVPVLIVGMPRSGTTLLEQILSSNPSLYGAGELTTLDEIARETPLPDAGFSDWNAFALRLRRLGQLYLDQVWQHSPQARYITDKMPANFRHLGLIHLMLPQARIIHAMRDPMDSCFSCYALRFRDAHDYSYDLGALGRFCRRYQQLMAHWHRSLPPGTILDLHYEALIEAPEREARRLLEYMGLPWNPDCLRFYETRRDVRTASVSQVRKPLYSGSVARWKRFEKHLAPLRAALDGL